MSTYIESIVTENLTKLGIKITDEKVRREVIRLAEGAVASAAEKVLKPKVLTKLLTTAIQSRKTTEPRQPIS